MKRTPLTRRAPMRRTPPKPHRKPAPDPGEWKATREAAKARGGGRCEARITDRCREADGRFAVLGEVQGHHRKLRSQGGGHGIVNVVAVCGWCHDWIHKHPAAAQARGLIVPRFHDPAVWALVLPDDSVVLLDTEGGYVPVMDAPEDRSA